jgi:hypothetical protein
MGRRAPQYNVVFVDEDGDLEIASFGEDIAGAKDRLATLPETKAKLFMAPPVPYRIHREPTVELGQAPAPRKRSTSTRRRRAAAAEETPAATPPNGANGQHEPQAATPLVVRTAVGTLEG